MYVILLISTIAFSVLFHGMETRCAVGLLDDSKGYMIKLTFMSETRKYNLRNIIETISTDRSYDTLYATCNLLETGVVALFGPQSESNHDIVQTVCDSKDIPHVQNRWDGKPERSSFTVNLYPHSQTLGAALADLVDARSWDTFAVFYDDYDSFCRVSEILKRDRKYFVALRQLDAERTGIYRSVLREVSKQNYKNYVVDCSLTCLSNFLLQAQQIGLMTSDHAYVISNPDLHTIDLEPYKYSETNITWLRLVDPDSDAAIDLAKRISKEQRHLDFDDELQEVLSHDIRSDMALLADGLQLLNMSLKSLPNSKKCASALSCGDSSSWFHGATFLSSLKMTSFDGVTGHVELNSMGYRDKFQLDIMELREGGIIKTGTWNTEHGVAPLPAHLEEEETIENNTFNVMVTKTPPFCMLKESEGPLVGNDRYEGFAIDIIHELSIVEKFNYTIKIRDDNKNGDYDSVTKDWSGMIGDVMKGVTDLAISDLTITAERGSAVDFTMPFMYLGISILYKKPSKAPPNFFSFAAPFATEVWIYIGVAYFIVSVSLFIMGRLCTSEWTNPYPCVDDPEYLVNQFSFRNSLWFMLGSLLQQGSEIAPIAYATRMTAGSWWFFTLIMVATYTANLAAFLAIETPDKPFSDVYGLVKNAPRLGIKYGAKAKGATETFFRDTKNPDLEPIFKYMNSNADAMVADNDKGVSRANSERYAFFMESVSIEYATQRNCNLTKVGDQLDEKGYGIAMRKNSTVLRNRLNIGLLKITENGKIDELRRKWWEERRGGGQCSDESKDEAPALTPTHVGGVFWVTVCGTVFAVFLVLIEMVLHIFKASIKQKKPFCRELKEELKFYLKFKGLVKPVRNRSSKSKSPESAGIELEARHDEPTIGFLPDITNPNGF